MWPHAKEGGRKGYRERVNERAGKREEIHNIGNHINFYQNRFINKSVRKNFLKFSERQIERRSFVVRCRRTYVLNNLNVYLYLKRFISGF